MTELVLQLGLIDFPSLIGPFIMGAGMWILLAWYLDRHIIPSLMSTHAVSPMLRVLVLIPFVLGLILATIGFLSFINRIWMGVLFLFALGKMIEAGVMIYGIRKFVYFFRKLTSFITRRSEEGGGIQRFIRSILFRLKYHIFMTLLAGVFGVLVFFLSYRVADNQLLHSLRYFGVVFVGIMGGAALLWDIKKSFPQVETIAAYGALLCIVGAELYAYPGHSTTLAQQLPWLTQSSVRNIERLIPIINFWDVLIVGFGNIAFLFGLVITVFFLVSVTPIQTPEGVKEKPS